MSDIDFGILPPADSAPFPLDEKVVRGGGAIVFKSQLLRWDEYVSRLLSREAKTPEAEAKKVAASDLTERRQERIAEMGPQVASLTIAGEDRTADAPRFLAALATARPDVVDAIWLHFIKGETAEKERGIDPEPIAGNS